MPRRTRVQFRSYALGARRVNIHDAGELRAFQARPHTNMVTPEFPGAHHGNANALFAHGFFFVSNFCGDCEAPSGANA